MTSYGEKEVDRVAVEQLFNKVALSEFEREIIMLRFGEDWMFHEIADKIGMKYFGRTKDNPLTEGSIRYHTKKILYKLAKAAGVNPNQCW